MTAFYEGEGDNLYFYRLKTGKLLSVASFARSALPKGILERAVRASE